MFYLSHQSRHVNDQSDLAAAQNGEAADALFAFEQPAQRFDHGLQFHDAAVSVLHGNIEQKRGCFNGVLVVSQIVLHM